VPTAERLEAAGTVERRRSGMLELPWRQPPLTLEQQQDLFMLLLEDDTEDAPWMVMGDLQFWSASSLAHSLRSYAREQGLGWYVASMLPIEYAWPGASRKKVLAPDLFVAFVAEHARSSFDTTVEGGFPPFVLEVVSPSSVARDEHEKRIAYDLTGVREYALFTPREGGGSRLAGYRRGAGGLEPWPPDEQGRLWSEVLGLHLVVRGRLLQAQTADGRVLLTPEEAEAARREAEAGRREAETARQEAEAGRQEAEAARRHAEEEVERLRRALERYGPGDAE
jgi:Uma2 family endonuclease